MDTKKLRQKILDLAIHGKLVPQDPNDEPASVLLERIRAEKEKLIKEGKIKAPKKSKSAGDTSHYPKDVPFEVPEGWQWCKITDVVDKLTDGTHNSPKNYPSGAYMYVTAKNIKRSRLDLSNVTYVTEDIHREIYSRCNPQKGDILYIKDGATCGISTINNLDEEFSLLSSVALIKPNKSILNTYINLFLQSDFCYRNVRDSMKGVGITRIILKQMELWDIPLPPYPEQKRIVAAAEQLLLITDAIEREQSALEEKIKKAKERVLDLAIRGKLVPQDPREEPEIELLRRVNSSFKPSHNLHYEDIPNSWTVCKLSDVCLDVIVPQRDKPKVFDGDIPWCRIEDIEGKYLNDSLSGRLVSKKTIQEMNLRICPVGTVICSCSASIGTQAIVTRPCCTNQTFIGLVPDEQVIFNEFLYYFLSSQTKHFLDIGTGTTIKYISREKFEEYRIPLPPLSEQRRIVERIEYCLSLLKQIQSATGIS